jgi:photosystem II stability/assembly factor-like uncharacterized protein
MFLKTCISLVLLLPASAQWQPQATAVASDLRGISVVNPKVAWASGSEGTYLRTTNGGDNWIAGTIAGAANLDFRGVQALGRNEAVLMSSGAGPLSQIFRTTDGRRWTRVYANRDPAVFFDAIAFWTDRRHGLVVSDPVAGHFLILRTSDGGATWTVLPEDKSPAALPGEGLFAASNSSLAVRGLAEAWFATGGAGSRIFHSTDGGSTWSALGRPIAAVKPSVGVFSLLFSDSRRGVYVGGDYRQPPARANTAGITPDGGATWIAAAIPPSGYRSCVALVPHSAEEVLVAVGPTGTDYSYDGGINWSRAGTVGYNAIRFSPLDPIGWAVGPDGRIAKFDGRVLAR